jgi:hypothetical protein
LLKVGFGMISKCRKEKRIKNPDEKGIKPLHVNVWGLFGFPLLVA